MTAAGAGLRQGLDETGYAVVDEVLDAETILDPLLGCLLRRLEQVEGRDLRQGRPVHEALSEALEEVVSSERPWSAQALDISLPQGNVAADTPLLLEPEMFSLLAAPALLDVIASVLGPQVWLSPVGHVRLKTPERAGVRTDGITGRVPWHQDNGVLLPEADEIEILTVWVPLVEVTRASGCLQVLPSPRGTTLAAHCPGPGGLSIPGALLPAAEPVPIEMRPGSVLFMHSRTVHSSLPNHAGHVRVSFDLRYQRAGSPTGRPQFPSFLLRDATGTAPVATFESWRDEWRASRARAAGQDLGTFNRWSPDAPVCA